MILFLLGVIVGMLSLLILLALAPSSHENE